MTTQDVDRRRPDQRVEDSLAEFALVLPEQVTPQTFTRLSVGLLRREKTLYEAAEANPASMLHALMEAARLGLEPGSTEVAFIPFKTKKKIVDEQRGRTVERWVWEIECIPQWQGIVKRMLNSGRVRSVHANVVYAGERFELRGDGMPPRHDIPDVFDRGGSDAKLRGAYAYAVLDDGTPTGALSRVAVVGPREIAIAKATSRGSTSEYSPWVKNEPEMWQKTAVRRLEDWVPASAVDMVWQARMAAAGHPRQPLTVEVDAKKILVDQPALAAPHTDTPTLALPDTPVDAAEFVDQVTGEISEPPAAAVTPDDTVVDAEVVDEEEVLR